MAAPVLTPKSNSSVSVLPVTGTQGNVLPALATKVYKTSDFVSGALDQVTYTYRKLGGDVLDLEIKEESVYAAYEEACLEYSYLINIHQSKNILSDVLGAQTGTFDHKGEMKAGVLSSSLGGDHVSLKYPLFDYAYARRVADGISQEANVGGSATVYSASFDIKNQVQDYDLQEIIMASGSSFSGSVDNKKILIKKVFYKTPRVMWRFFGYQGGLNVIGNLTSYGQYADDSTFQVVPVWENKLQAMAYEDALYTRTSQCSYELRNNKLRIFPNPSAYNIEKMWFEFTIPGNNWEAEGDTDIGIDGINNMNTLPLDNIPYENINSIGKQWIRRFALSLSKETLGLTRSKFATIPIPGESVTLNGEQLASQAREEQEKLREELKTILDEMTYGQLMSSDAELIENANKIQQKIPLLIFVG
tara:strand:+ start:3031 stop:4284 length:1254 start_codon:yes stop_codon:yes gene_type:complete